MERNLLLLQGADTERLPCQICQLIGDDRGNVGEVVREATFELDVG